MRRVGGAKPLCKRLGARQVLSSQNRCDTTLIGRRADLLTSAVLPRLKKSRQLYTKMTAFSSMPARDSGAIYSGNSILCSAGVGTTA